MACPSAELILELFLPRCLFNRASASKCHCILLDLIIAASREAGAFTPQLHQPRTDFLFFCFALLLSRLFLLCEVSFANIAADGVRGGRFHELVHAVLAENVAAGLRQGRLGRV